MVHLARALVSVESFRIGDVPSHVVVDKDTVGSHDFTGVAHGVAHLNGAECLRERRVLVFHLSLVLQLREPHYHALRCGDVPYHLRQVVLHHLEAGDRLPELLALLRIREGVLVRAHHAARGDPGYAPARHPQYASGGSKRRVVLETVFLGDTAVGHRDQRILDHAKRHLVLDLFRLETRGGFVVDHEALHLTGAQIAGPDDGEITPRGVADPFLLPVEHPGIALASRGRLEPSGRPGTHVGLRQAEGSDLLHPRHWRQPLLLLLFGATEEDRPHREAAMNAVERRNRAVNAGKLHRDEAPKQRVAPRASVAFEPRASDVQLADTG